MTTERDGQPGSTSEAGDAALLLLGGLHALDAFAEAATEPARAGALDDGFVSAALGLLSLRRSLRRWARLAAAERRPASAPMRRSDARRGALR